MAERTKDRLAAALREIGLDEIAREAERGLYDDYESPNAMPIHSLVHRLTEEGSPAALALAERAKAGDFDGTKEEANAWATSPEGQAMLRELIGGQER